MLSSNSSDNSTLVSDEDVEQSSERLNVSDYETMYSDSDNSMQNQYCSLASKDTKLVLFNKLQRAHANQSVIRELDIADGLKDLLISNGFTNECLETVTHTTLSSSLGLDSYIAKIIVCAIQKKINSCTDCKKQLNLIY